MPFHSLMSFGDYFHLTINKAEAEIIRQIYKWYLEEGYGATKIANMLNEKGLKSKKRVTEYFVKEFQRIYKAKDENLEYAALLQAQLAKLKKSRERYMEMYTDDLISREELNEKIGGMRKEMERLENNLKLVSYHLTKGEQVEGILFSLGKKQSRQTAIIHKFIGSANYMTGSLITVICKSFTSIKHSCLHFRQGRGGSFSTRYLL